MAWRLRPGEMPSRPSSIAICWPNPAMRRVMYGQNDVSFVRGMMRPTATPHVCVGALLKRRLLNGTFTTTT